MLMKKILFLGDSITHAFDTKAYLSEFDIVNRGISGDNSRNLMKRLDNELKITQPDCVFILIGTNDFAVGLNNREILSNIRTIINRVCASVKPERTVLTSILPTLNIENRPNKTIDLVNSTLQNLSSELGIHYWDLNTIMKDASGSLIPDYTIDGLHLSPKAYSVWAEQLRLFLKLKNL